MFWNRGKLSLNKTFCSLFHLYMFHMHTWMPLSSMTAVSQLAMHSLHAVHECAISFTGVPHMSAPRKRHANPSPSPWTSQSLLPAWPKGTTADFVVHDTQGIEHWTNTRTVGLLVVQQVRPAELCRTDSVTECALLQRSQSCQHQPHNSRIPKPFLPTKTQHLAMNVMDSQALPCVHLPWIHLVQWQETRWAIPLPTSVRQVWAVPWHATCTHGPGDGGVLGTVLVRIRFRFGSQGSTVQSVPTARKFWCSELKSAQGTSNVHLCASNTSSIIFI